MNINFPEGLEFNNNRWIFILKAKASAALRRILLSITFLVTPIQLAKFFAWKLKSFINAIFHEQDQFAQPVSPKFGNSIDYKVALILHVYYPEIGLEILNQVLPKANYFDKILISHNMNPDALSKFSSQVPPKLFAKSQFMWVENRFRDCGPFIAAARSPYLSDCDVFLKLHTKKSPHLGPDISSYWRIQLISDLLELLSLPQKRFGSFVNSNPLWTCPEKWLSTKSQSGFNGFNVFRLTQQLGVPFQGNRPFPTGNMYWLNRRFLDVVVNIDPGKMQPLYESFNILDGGFPHALERLPSQFVMNFPKEIAGNLNIANNLTLSFSREG